MDELNARLGIPKTLTDLGVKNPDVEAVVASALNDPSCGGNSVELTESNVRKLLEAAL
ncbi:MAG: iron-containing alcohol dehydrogenase [Pseudomonadota bacterium]